jgi:DNA-binding MarR family transcriptional regulator
MVEVKDRFLGKWLATAHIKLFHLYTKMFQKEGFNLTYEQFILLRIINFKQGVTHKELAEMMNKDKTSISRAINILEDNHKVVRITLDNDNRKKGVYLTKEGREHLTNVMPRFEKIKKEFEKGFEDGELEKTIQLLKKIIITVEKFEERL